MSDYETQRRHDLAEKDTFVAPGTPEGWIEWIAATDEQIEALAKRHAEARTRDVYDRLLREYMLRRDNARKQTQ